MARVHVPHLARKLKALMQRSATIKTYVALAQRLDGLRGGPIGANNLTVWVTGNDVRPPESVPAAHIATICRLFELVDQSGNPQVDLLCGADWDEFAEQAGITPQHRFLSAAFVTSQPTR